MSRAPADGSTCGSRSLAHWGALIEGLLSRLPLTGGMVVRVILSALDDADAAIVLHAGEFDIREIMYTLEA